MMSLVFILVLIYISAIHAYDWGMGNTTVWLSASAYCPTNTYLTRTFKGYAEGFVATHVIDNKPRDVQVRFRTHLLSSLSYFPL